MPGIEFFEQLKKKTIKDYSCLAWQRSTQRLRRCYLKQMLTDDDGYPIITTVHFSPLKRVVSEVVFFHYKTNTPVNFRVILNSSSLINSTNNYNCTLLYLCWSDYKRLKGYFKVKNGSFQILNRDF